MYKPFLIALVAICVASLPFAQFSQAAIISTESAAAMAERHEQVQRINRVLAMDSVQETLVSMGVDPADALERVHSLTDQELAELESRLPEMPAGGTGVVELIGIIAIVLIVLELLNVTNFFTEF